MLLADIEQALKSQFAPSHVEVINESHMHSVPKDSLTHIKVIMVSESFQEKSLLNRHRDVYNCLGTYMQQGLHAVSVFAYTPEEWQANNTVPSSPPCRGGRKKEQDN